MTVQAKTSLPTILVVDDEPHSTAAMQLALEDEFDILTASGAAEAKKHLQDQWVQVIICDQRMPDIMGTEFLAEVRENWPEIVRIIITGYTDPADMIQAINEAGVHQFITKPWHPEELMMAARNATKLFQLSRDNERMALEMRYLASTSENRLSARREALKEGRGFESIMRSVTSPMNGVINQARQFASFHVPVLLTGDHGTGKADVARAMHLVSLRSDRAFYSFNLAGVPDDVAAVELFGAKQGILPGGVTKTGLFRRADRGTLYLGGIDTLSPALQLDLLSSLRDGEFSPVGGKEKIKSDPRLIVGADHDLLPLVENGTFRKDLYHLLSTANLKLPSLRERHDDIALLADQILSELVTRHGKQVNGFDMAAIEFLENYDWPGNLPELTNEITRMLILADSRILGAELISRHILRAPRPQESDSPSLGDLCGQGVSLKDQVEIVETRILREALARHRWNKSRAANELGLSRVGLRAKLDRYGICDPTDRATSETEGV